VLIQRAEELLLRRSHDTLQPATRRQTTGIVIVRCKALDNRHRFQIPQDLSNRYRGGRSPKRDPTTFAALRSKVSQLRQPANDFHQMTFGDAVRPGDFSDGDLAALALSYVHEDS
jgi:hypothetical protein